MVWDPNWTQVPFFHQRRRQINLFHKTQIKWPIKRRTLTKSWFSLHFEETSTRTHTFLICEAAWGSFRTPLPVQFPAAIAKILKKSYCHNNSASARTNGLLLPTVYYTTKDTSKCFIIVISKGKDLLQNAVSQVTKIIFKFKKKNELRGRKKSQRYKKVTSCYC